jgi:hypothetical protein
MTSSLARRHDDQRGSLAVAMIVILVATGLIVATTAVVFNGLKTSRRAGDSANALQLADAAVNDAIKQLSTTGGTSLGPITKQLGTAGDSYTYSATLDTLTPDWHIDAWGTDATGVKRHVKAEAVPDSLFGNAFFVDSAVSMPSGVAMDSFVDGSSLQATCSRNGILGSNDPGNLLFNANGGNGNGQQNCTDAVWYGATNTWTYPADGCIAYHDPAQPEVWPPQYGMPNHCPPQPYTKTKVPLYPIPQLCLQGECPAVFVTQSSTPGTASQSWPNVPCDATHHIPGGVRYYVTQVTLFPGCQVDAANGPAIIYTTGSVNIGIQNGNSSTNTDPGVNPPLTSNPLVCPTYSGGDWRGESRNFYCPGWSSNLQIFMTNGSTTPTINFGNHVRFWGVVFGVNAQIATAPQVEMWGALRVAGLTGSAQLYLHYDEALGKLVTNIYVITDWREEPQ